jgi:hypothetical protein
MIVIVHFSSLPLPLKGVGESIFLYHATQLNSILYLLQQEALSLDERIKVEKRTAIASTDCIIRPSLATHPGKLFSDFVDLFTNSCICSLLSQYTTVTSIPHKS